MFKKNPADIIQNCSQFIIVWVIFARAYRFDVLTHFVFGESEEIVQFGIYIQQLKTSLNIFLKTDQTKT